MYGVHPHYTVLEEDGNAHSVAIINSNAQGKYFQNIIAEIFNYLHPYLIK
jgi:hypothetical protein